MTKLSPYPRAVATPVLAEEWRPVVGHEGLYEVSSYARVRTVSRKVRAGKRPSRVVPSAIRNPTCGSNGYLTHTLAAVDGGERTLSLHRIVCQAFNGPPPFHGALVRHLDDDRAHNFPANLAWGSNADNTADAQRNGKVCRGDASGRAKLTEEQVASMRAAYRRGSRVTGCTALASQYGVSPGHVHHLIAGTRRAGATQ